MIIGDHEKCSLLTSIFNAVPSQFKVSLSLTLLTSISAQSKMTFLPTFLALCLFLSRTTGTGWNGHVCEDLSATCALVAEYMALGFGSLCEIPDPSNPGQDYGFHYPLTCNRCVQDGMVTMIITLANDI